MHTIQLETIRASWPPPDVTPGWSEMNKFGQVSSDAHQMPLVGVPRSDVGRGGRGEHGQGERVTVQWGPMRNG